MSKEVIYKIGETDLSFSRSFKVFDEDIEYDAPYLTGKVSTVPSMEHPELFEDFLTALFRVFRDFNENPLKYASPEDKRRYNDAISLQDMVLEEFAKVEKKWVVK